MTARVSIFDNPTPAIDADVDFVLYAGRRDEKYIARHVTNPNTYAPMLPTDKVLLYGAVIEALELLCMKEAGIPPLRATTATMGEGQP